MPPVGWLCASVLWQLCDLDTDNKIGDEGAIALAPELGKLTQLQTLNLHCE